MKAAMYGSREGLAILHNRGPRGAGRERRCPPAGAAELLRCYGDEVLARRARRMTSWPEPSARYLAERAFPLGRITYLLGYSDLSAFTRISALDWSDAVGVAGGGRSCQTPRRPPASPAAQGRGQHGSFSDSSNGEPRRPQRGSRVLLVIWGAKRRSPAFPCLLPLSAVRNGRYGMGMAELSSAMRN